MTFEHTRSKSKAVIFSVLAKAEVDRATRVALLVNIMPVVIGPVTAFLVATGFSPVAQGYYYTFGSLAALQFVAELGMGQTIIQFGSHEWLGLTLDRKSRIVGSADSLSKLISLSHICFRWYGLSAALIILGLGPAGYLFFSLSSVPDKQWVWPWFSYCAALGFNVALTPVFYLLQATNQMYAYWVYRLIQQILSGLALWLSILVGAGLWTLPIAAVSSLVWGGLFIIGWRAFYGSLLSSPYGPRISWWKEVWPLQWKIAISGISAYFTTLVFPPILFQVAGPVAAGQMGLTVTLNNIILAVSGSWIVTKAPRFGILVAQQRYRELDRQFWNSLLISLVMVCTGAVTIWTLFYFLLLYQHPLSLRVLPPLPLGLFLMASALYSVTTSFSVYLRAHKKEPLAIVYLISGVIIGVLGYFLGIDFGAVGVTAGYLAVLALFQIPLSLLIFWRCRAEWHKEPGDQLLVSKP